ncbi:MAG: EamA family transporter [Deinococcales bacterium]
MPSLQGSRGFVIFGLYRWPAPLQVVPVDKLSLVLVAIFAYIFLGEHLSRQEWLGISLVASGVVVLALKR